MLVTDMDDTLLDSEHQVSKANSDAIIGAQARGLQFVLASGRPTYAMRDYAKNLALDTNASYYLSYNGAIIINAKDDTVWYEEMLSMEDAHLLYDISQEHDMEILSYIGDEIICETRSTYVQKEIDLTGMPFRQVSSFKDAVKDKVVKCILLKKPKHLNLAVPIIQEKYSDRFSMSISKPFFFEVMKKGVDKGKSLTRLAAHLGIGLEEIVAVGDSYNDASMLEVAGYPVAVANAKPPLKEMASHIAPSHKEDALKYVIEQLIEL